MPKFIKKIVFDNDDTTPVDAEWANDQEDRIADAYDPLVDKTSDISEDGKSADFESLKKGGIDVLTEEDNEFEEIGDGFIKYKNGTMVQYGVKAVTLAGGSGYNNFFYYNANLGNFPIPFVGVPSVCILKGENASTLFMEGNQSVPSATAFPQYRCLHSANSQIGVTMRVNYYVIGKWK